MAESVIGAPMHTNSAHETACGFENPPGAQFCGSCGQPLRATCPRCGTDVPAGFSFCTACGNPLTAPGQHVQGPSARIAEPTAPLPSSSERRLVSVLFCDLVDFTGLAESLDPEEVRDVLSRYFESAREIVARYGGSIEKFIGDAVVAVWGSPVAREDDAERAVRAALEIVDAVGDLRGAAFPRPLAARAAVATGESAVMIGLADQGMVAGDIVNTSARLQTAAQPGTVLINDATRRATASTITARPAGKQQLKGKSAPVHTWRAIRPATADSRQAGATDPPLTGRGRELDELVTVFSGVRKSGRSRLVSVVGIAGIGKSRLLRELERQLRERLPQLGWYVGRAPWLGAGTAFAPLAEMTRRALRIAESDASEVARRKLTSALSDISADDDERVWMEPRLAVLLDPDEEGRFAREEQFAAWSRLFELLAERGPLALIFEDAQRADPALLDFVEYFVEEARTRPVLVVTLARPELLEARPAWGAGLRNFTSLHLDKLPNADITRLLGDLAPDLRRNIVTQVLRRADGVPLYAVEMTRMLQGASGPPAEDGVPTSLHALIAARIDGLGQAERSLLMSAAVLGRRFSTRALAAVSEADPATMGPSVERLLRQEILATDQDAPAGARGQLKFQEQLVQDVAYRTLARGERRRLHLRAARYLESLDDEELVEMEANHLVKAYRADPAHADAVTIGDRARPALVRAASRARALHAPERALALLDEALDMAVEDDERANIVEDAAAAAQAAGNSEVAERYWRRLVQLRTDLDDRVGAGRATARLASLLLVIQRYDAALGEVERALDGLGEASPNDAAAVELAGQLARAHLLRGDSPQAAAWAERALTSAGRLGLTAVATDALITRGTARVQTGQHATGIEDLNEAIAQCSANELLGLELRARNNMAWALVPDDPRRTVETARKGFEVGRQKGIRDVAVQLASVALPAAVDTGDWDWALATITEIDAEPMSPAHRIDISATHTILRALRGTPGPGQPLTRLGPIPPDTDPQVHGLADHAQAWVAFVRGRYSRAVDLAHRAAERAIGFNRHAALILSARAALWAGDGKQARHDLDTIAAEPLPGRAIAASLRALLAGADALAGQPAAARAGYREAMAAMRELDLPLPLVLTLLEREAFLRSTAGGNVEARALIERLGAKGLSRLLRT
jgi:class 3 adenylate cyclase/tetratricopeptide (TPR) repeat protein